jgi:chemotaxis protein methyltransferase CheR
MTSVGDQNSKGVDSAQWEQLRELVEAETGMDLSDNRVLRLRDAVEKVLATHNPPRSLGQILADPDYRGVFLEHVTAQLTVGETFFFRNEHHFQALAEQVFPQIQRENKANKEIRIWAAGCSTGEEPYSLAILLDGLLASGAGWHVSILATDLNSEFLERARRGLYREWSFRGTEVHRDRRYFVPEGKRYRLLPRILKRVRFAYLNLIKDVYPSPLNGTLGLDLIVFRNVAIYLKAEIVNAIIDRFYRSLRPGGWLLLGETELNLAGTRQFDVQRFGQAIFYRKQSETAASDKPAGPALPDSLLPAPWPLSAAPAPPPRDIAQQTRLEALASRDDGRSTPPPLEERLEHHLNRREFTESERLIDAVSARKERAKARLRYVLHLLSCARIRQAREMLEKCLSEDPLQIEAHLLQASLAEEAGDPAEAERAYRRALYLDRQCAIAHFHLALVQQGQGNFENSRRSLKTVLELTENRDPNGLAEHSDGVCHGRLREMAEMVLGL